MNWIIVNCRWNDENSQKLYDMGLSNGSENYILKPITINLDEAFSIEVYDNHVMINNSAHNDNGYITDIKKGSDRHLKLISLINPVKI